MSIAALVPLSAWLSCAAHTPEHVLSQGGIVDPQKLEASLRCPKDGIYTQGQTMGVQTALWCEKPAGVKNGPFIDWYENHQKKSAGLYVEGHRQGLWTFWLANGQVDSQMTYEMGNPVTPGQAPGQPPTPQTQPPTPQPQTQPPAPPQPVLPPT